MVVRSIVVIECKRIEHEKLEPSTEGLVPEAGTRVTSRFVEPWCNDGEIIVIVPADDIEPSIVLLGVEGILGVCPRELGNVDVEHNCESNEQ